MAPILQRALKEKGFEKETPPQLLSFDPIIEGKNVLLMAPTGSGKTEAAFLPLLNRLYLDKVNLRGISLLYITPLRALNRDLLERLEYWCKRLDLRLAVRHGDTQTQERKSQSLLPPNILITTPETLQILLASKNFRKHLSNLKYVIVDEIHELAEDKRGSQLALALERLRINCLKEIQIVGLSATIGSPEKVAKFLVGKDRDCLILKAEALREMRFNVVFPEPEKEDEELAKVLFTYPEVACRLRFIKNILDKSKSALVFTNTRSEAEILANRFKLWLKDFPILVHHGSLSRETRIYGEAKLKRGELYGLICTSSLEMGIDIGPLDIVIQYNSPRQVTRILQRVGRSGHSLDRVAKGIIITQDSDDALEAIVIAKRALEGKIEEVIIFDKPLDALHHQLAGLLLYKSRWSIDEIKELVNKSYPYKDLSREELVRVMLYMHERYPRLAWLDERGFSKPPNHRELYHYYFSNLSMIPEEKQYLVITEDKQAIGVLDEAFIAEYGEIGTKFVEGGKVWKITQIYKDKVYVREAEDALGAIPTWVGDEIPVPFEVAEEVGRIRRICYEKLREGYDLESIASEFERQYPVTNREVIKRALKECEEQFKLNIPIGDDKNILIEEAQGKVIIHSSFGHKVNRTLARILSYELSHLLGRDVKSGLDPYRIIIDEEITGDLIFDLFKELYKDIEKKAFEALSASRIFKRRFIHVGRKFGALEKDVDLSYVMLNRIIDSLKDTPIYDEAMNTCLTLDSDLEKTKEILERVNRGEIKLIKVKLKELSPLAKISYTQRERKLEVIEPERIKKLILNSVKARILSEVKLLVCMNCLSYLRRASIEEIEENFTCPNCGSKRIGLTSEEEEKVRKLLVKIKEKEIPKRFKRIYSDLMKSSQLFEKYGSLALFALSASGLNFRDVKEILQSHKTLDDNFLEKIVSKEKEALARRFGISLSR